jgi:hypothetical protein
LLEPFREPSWSPPRLDVLQTTPKENSSSN